MACLISRSLTEDPTHSAFLCYVSLPSASIDDLEPAILVFHKLVRNGVPKSKLVIALCRVGTESEETGARSYIEQASYAVLESGLRIGRPGIVSLP